MDEETAKSFVIGDVTNGQWMIKVGAAEDYRAWNWPY